VTVELFRVDGILDASVIREKTVLVAGLGSLGSLTLLNLAYPFKKFILIDPEIVTEENVERHALGYAKIGLPKVAGMKDYLIDRGIQPDTIDVFQERVQDVLGQGREDAIPDLILLAIDRRSARLFVNSYAVRFNIPLIDGGVFAKGRGGQVIVAPSPKDICYRDAEVFLGADQDEETQRADYGVNIAEIPESPHTVPALRASIDSIAAHMARLGVDILKGKEVEAHILQEFFETESITIIPEALAGVVETFCKHQSDVGLLSTMDARRLITNECALSGTGIYQLPIPRWQSCPEHAPSIDINDLV
jgi:molybdopterin/thiamine biosynthesis adenylyltransferase